MNETKYLAPDNDNTIILATTVWTTAQVSSLHEFAISSPYLSLYPTRMRSNPQKWSVSSCPRNEQHFYLPSTWWYERLPEQVFHAIDPARHLQSLQGPKRVTRQSVVQEPTFHQYVHRRQPQCSSFSRRNHLREQAVSPASHRPETNTKLWAGFGTKCTASTSPTFSTRQSHFRRTRACDLQYLESGCSNSYLHQNFTLEHFCVIFHLVRSHPGVYVGGVPYT